MTELDDLYQEVVLEHKRNPRNFGMLESHTHGADGHNPLCGDQVRLRLNVENGRIEDLRFSGEGCAISTASASMMTEAVKGKRLEDARALVDAFLDSITRDRENGDTAVNLGKLSVFRGVRRFPSRVKCAGLAWHTLKSAMDGDGTSATGDGETVNVPE